MTRFTSEAGDFRPVGGADLSSLGPGLGAGGSGTPAGLVLTAPFACGYFGRISATQVGFIPYFGDLVKINGVVYQLPAAGVRASNTGTFVNQVGGQNLVASTQYLVYVFNNAGTLALNFSSTGHATSSTTGNSGIEIMSGNDAYSLVGMVFTDASAQFQDGNFWHGVLSWFNRVAKIGVLNITNATTTSINAVYGSLAAGSCIMCNWGAEGVDATLQGQFTTTGAGAIGSVGIGVDASNTVIINQFCFVNSSTILGNYAMSIFSYQPGEGAHNWVVNGYASLNATASTLSNENPSGYVRTRG
jgi:hypothetical protein